MSPEDRRQEATPTRFRLAMNNREVAVPESGLVIGRAAPCDIKLGGGLVSRRHARVRPTDDGLVVEDLGSRNGVVVNERKIASPTVLAHGDVIAVGVETLQVIDDHVRQRPAHLSTLPPSPCPALPYSESDADGPEQVTVGAATRLDVLSQREREVLDLVVRGHTQKEIADLLHVSVKTIESHRAHLSEKLRCKTRAELVSYAIAAGVLRGR